ncbi:ImmA/IrrE family metallo-endopeptidase [Pedobacter borealis]|uniref:ImmA/IrrE family metallo-endopeptidase n=1 Tax=Pedobacter borealis TaxID=475254 RepID=UPI00068FCCE2|nr:ImmA/IrrE family metallo-endopeptidase [Pedobacter borealis]
MSQQTSTSKRNNTKLSFKRGFKTEAEKKSIFFRKELGLKSHDFLCAFKLCDYLSIPILTPNNINGLDRIYLDNLLGKGSEFWSAATIPLSNNEYLIIHNDSHSPARQQSNLMHELAHVILKHTTSESSSISGLGGLLRDFNTEQENEAEWLGASLQLPREALSWCLYKKMTTTQIAAKFSASEIMVNYRINITGVRNQFK